MNFYDWNQIPEEQVNPLAKRQMIHGETMSVIRRQLAKGAVTRLHRHAEEQISMIERGKVRFTISGEEHVVSTVQALAISPDALHSLEAIEDSVMVDLFAMPKS